MSDVMVRPGKIAKWGNSAAIRIASSTLEHAHLHVDDAVDVVVEEDQIIIRRQRPKVTMAELLARFDPSKHRHNLAFDVAPVGSETID